MRVVCALTCINAHTHTHNGMEKGLLTSKHPSPFHCVCVCVHLCMYACSLCAYACLRECVRVGVDVDVCMCACESV
jgi:hypothetical protein